MNLLQSVILGFVQGITEFLPISSTGHLVLFQRIFGLGHGTMIFDIAVHIATLTGVFVVLGKDVKSIIKKPFCRMTAMLIIGTLPTVVIGFLLKDVVESVLASGRTLGLEFLITGSVLLVSDNIGKKVVAKKNSENQMKVTNALIIGAAQGLAVMPAISRSGLTLAGSLIMGLEKEFAIRFSLLLSVPAIIGAAFYDLFRYINSGENAVSNSSNLMTSIFTDSQSVFILLAGMAAAAVSGYVAVKFMVRIFSKISLKYFSYYVFAIGILIIAFQLVGGDSSLFGRLF